MFCCPSNQHSCISCILPGYQLSTRKLECSAERGTLQRILTAISSSFASLTGLPSPGLCIEWGIHMIHKRPGDKRKSEDQEKGRGGRVQSAPEGKKNLVGAFLPPLSSSPKRLLMCLFEISTGVGVRKKKVKITAMPWVRKGAVFHGMAEITRGLVFILVFCSRRFQERL